MAVALRWKKVRQRRSAAGSFCALNSPGLSCYPTGYCEIAPQGHFLALRAQGATSAVGLLAMTNLVVGTVGDATL